MKRLTLVLLTTALLSACSPKYDWRDYHSGDAPYSVLFPGKPASTTRPVQLGDLKVDMTMTATEIDDVVFAVGSAKLTDPAQAPAALEAMQTALVANISGTISSSKSNTSGAQTVLDVDAKGAQNGASMRLIGRFISKNQRIYQVIVMGQEKHIVADTVDTYLSSFKLD